MFAISKNFLLIIVSLFPALLLAQSAAITLDEDFNDWTPGLASYTDPVDAPGGIDLLDMQVTNDADWLYIKFTMDQEVDVTDNIIPHDLRIYLDTDNDPGTGFFQQSGYGSELCVLLKEHYAWFDVPSPGVQVGLADFSFRIAPTVSSDTFELAIRRDAQPNGIDDLFLGDSVRILIREANSNDRMPDSGTVFSYTFDETAVNPIVLTDLNKADPDHIRIVAYNVYANGLINAGRVDNFESIVTALGPDIIGYSECGNTSSAQAKALMDAWIPLGTEDGWYVDKAGDRITCSKWPITDSWSLSAQFPVLIDLPSIYGADLLFTNSHLSCCANDASRQNQVDQYVAFILDAKTPGGAIDLPLFTPFVYGGDLNLVGFSQQLTTLITGNIQDTGTYGPGGPLDWDGTDITDQIARQSDKRMAYTWRNDSEGAYPPGRLDFQMYSDAVITMEKAFTLQTEVMSPARLALSGLDNFDTGDASDHFPVVVDYSIPFLLDTDGDLIPDESDNCPDDANFDQSDWNNDGTGDLCQDTDADGLMDADEILLYGTDPDDPDSDNDGLTDGEEVLFSGTEPLIQDTDGDGLTDGLETTVGLNPLLVDSDGDGCNDDLDFSQQCPGSLTCVCPADFDNNGLVDTSDLLQFLTAFGLPCD